MPVTTNTRKLAALLGASGAGIGTDGLLQSAAVDANIATQAELDAVTAASDTADNKITSNQAILAIRQAADHNDVKYNLQDRIIDNYYDASGIDASPSTNHILASGAYSSSGTSVSGGNSTDTSITNYTTRVFTGNGALTVTGSLNVSILVVGGGASGGCDYGGGGGAGGLVYDAVYALTANTYDAVIGAGGTGVSATGPGNDGVDSTWTINGGAMQFTAKGGGRGAGSNDRVGANGGSGGGASWGAAGGGTTQAGTTQGVTPDVSIGYVGGLGLAADEYNTGGGGGAGSIGQAATEGSGSSSGDGGAGYNAGAIFGTALGESGYFASGGGGGFAANGDGWEAGAATNGGGTSGGASGGANSTAADNNTGGGSGGGGSSGGDSGNGGSGVILVRYLTADAPGITNLTLQSTDTAAETEADFADMVMLIEDTTGTATVNTDIKGYISEDSGVTFTQGTLVDEGDWGTNKRILAFHDLDISAQSGTAMCYKITTHNQSASKETKIHATSIGWK